MSGDGESSTGLTTDEWERIETFAEMDSDERRPEDLLPDLGDEADRPSPTASDETDETGVSRGSTRSETHTTCKRIRRTMAQATTAREVVESVPSKHTSEVMRHAYGDCRCNHDIPATASPQIRESECQHFRTDYSNGYSVSEIAEKWARSDNTVTRHIFGRCSHDSRPTRTSVSEVEEWVCKRLRTTYNRNPQLDVFEVATAMKLRVKVASTHLFGYCSCEHGEPPGDRTSERDG